jgi:hypothetical protein
MIGFDIEQSPAFESAGSGTRVEAQSRPCRSTWQSLVGLLRQSAFGRLAGCEDMNDAERFRRYLAMRWIVGGKAAQGHAASVSQIGRFQDAVARRTREPLCSCRIV